MERGPLGIDRALEIAICAAEGLTRAHESGIIHLGLTSSCITLVKGDTVRIIDFGLARLAARSGWTAWVAGRDGLVPVSGTAQGRTGGRAVRHLVARRRAVRDDRRQASVRKSPWTGDCQRRPSRRAGPASCPAPRGAGIDRSGRGEGAFQGPEGPVSDGPGAPGGPQTRLRGRPRCPDQRRSRDCATDQEPPLLPPLGGRRRIPASASRGPLCDPPIGREEQFSTHPKTILITSFQNLTGIDSLDYFQFALQHQLITSLEQSVYFRPTSWGRLGDLKKQAGRPDSGVIDEALGLELGRLDNAEALLAASFSRTGDRFTITTRLVDVATQQTLMTPVTSGRGIESFFDQVDQLSHKISTGLGVSAARTQETIRPIEEISTRSQLAYQLALTGWELVREGKRLEALQNFELAVKEDSLFVSAWIGLRSVYLDLGYLTKGWHAADKAIALFGKGSERDRLMIARIDTSLRAVVMGHAGATYLDFLRFRVMRFPKDKTYLYALGLELLTTHGRVDEAIEVFRQILISTRNSGSS